MRRKPRIIHILWVRGTCCLRGKPRRNGDRLIEFLMDGVVILSGLISCLGWIILGLWHNSEREIIAGAVGVARLEVVAACREG